MAERYDMERSPRRARICTECRQREFGDPDWKCPKHPRKTVDQPDNVYMGKLPRRA